MKSLTVLLFILAFTGFTQTNEPNSIIFNKLLNQEISNAVKDIKKGNYSADLHFIPENFSNLFVNSSAELLKTKFEKIGLNSKNSEFRISIKIDTCVTYYPEIISEPWFGETTVARTNKLTGNILIINNADGTMNAFYPVSISCNDTIIFSEAAGLEQSKDLIKTSPLPGINKLKNILTPVTAGLVIAGIFYMFFSARGK